MKLFTCDDCGWTIGGQEPALKINLGQSHYSWMDSFYERCEECHTKHLALEAAKVKDSEKATACSECGVRTLEGHWYPAGEEDWYICDHCTNAQIDEQRQKEQTEREEKEFLAECQEVLDASRINKEN